MMIYKVLQEGDEFELLIQGSGEEDAFKLGRLNAVLDGLAISHVASSCNPSFVKIRLQAKPEND